MKGKALPGEKPACNQFRSGHGEGGEEGQAPGGVGHLQPEKGVLLLAGEEARQEGRDSWQQKLWSVGVNHFMPPCSFDQLVSQRELLVIQFQENLINGESFLNRVKN